MQNFLVMWRHSCYHMWKPDILKMYSWHYNYVLGFEFKRCFVKDRGGGYIYLFFRSSNKYQTPNLLWLTSGGFIAANSWFKNGFWYIFDRMNKKAISRIATVTLSYEESEATGQFWLGKAIKLPLIYMRKFMVQLYRLRMVSAHEIKRYICNGCPIWLNVLTWLKLMRKKYPDRRKTMRRTHVEQRWL